MKSSLAHTAWDCAYHIVWIPKYRRKVMYGQLRRELVGILKDLAGREDGVEIAGGSACVDHIHICLRIPPKYAADKVVGRPKGRSAMIPRERHPECRGATGRDRTLWARGYHAGTVGLDEARVREYIKKQEEASRFEWRRAAPLAGLSGDGRPTRRGAAAAVQCPYRAKRKPPAMPGVINFSNMLPHERHNRR